MLMPPLVSIVLASRVLAVLAPAEAAAQELAAECEYAPDGPSHVVVGSVECLRFDSAMMGGGMPFSYYVPPGCDPALGRKCPVFYFLHGLSGNYQVGLGPRGQADSHWVRALASGPPVDARTLAEPWLFESTASWVPKPPLDFVLIAPHGVTLPGGYGPSPDAPKDTGWQDFHPQYWEGGESQVFDGPPPRGASMVTEELIPYVEAHLPVIGAARPRWDQHHRSRRDR
jgi:hypothetical protein